EADAGAHVLLAVLRIADQVCPFPGVASHRRLAGHLEHDVRAATAAQSRPTRCALLGAAAAHEALHRAARRTSPQQVANRHYIFPVMDSQRNCHTRQTASRMIFFDIFDSPWLRSTKTIGISQMRKPLRHARMLTSIWNEYPLDWMRSSSIASRTSRRNALKPPVASATGSPVTLRAYTFAKYDSSSRLIGQLTTVTRPPR